MNEPILHAMKEIGYAINKIEEMSALAPSSSNILESTKVIREKISVIGHEVCENYIEL